MAPIGNSLSAKISRWKLLGNRVEERLAEIPHVTEAHARLKQLTAEAEAAQAEFELHRAAWRSAADRTEQLAREGEALRTRLTGALHFQLGPKSLELIEFGLKPRRPAGGRRKTPTPEVKPPPPQGSAPATTPAPGQPSGQAQAMSGSSEAPS